MKHMKMRGVVLSLVTVMVSATTVVLASAPAQATPDECDGTAVIGVFQRVGYGASFNYAGRVVELQNESALDLYSRAEIKSGRKSGDQVWVDRSFRAFNDFKGPVSNADAESQGWKQCGPFSGSRTQSVLNHIWAARACARMDGVSKCGAWYVD
ncbi:hypothetical protein [Streptosporangium sp. H16]|uniref:hypothetical protein n=1 Tax=Streptosporangium sp. H16 TaxID=3444184 RepID=UPI003F79B5D3